jgi:hypothetical protein
MFSPKLLDGKPFNSQINPFYSARILSPESFSFILLSPAVGVLRAGSPNTMNVLVLSPSFGTYQLFSGNRYAVQILSPGILGVDSQPLLREPFAPGGHPSSKSSIPIAPK